MQAFGWTEEEADPTFGLTTPYWGEEGEQVPPEFRWVEEWEQREEERKKEEEERKKEQGRLRQQKFREKKAEEEKAAEEKEEEERARLGF